MEECEIKRLEDELERMFNENPKRYKGISLGSKSAFEIEMLRAEFQAIAERGKTNSYKIALVGVLVTFCLQLLINSNFEANFSSLITVIISYIVLIVGWMTIINVQGKTRGLDTKGLELIDMLLERKKELESGE